MLSWMLWRNLNELWRFWNTAPDTVSLVNPDDTLKTVAHT